MKIYMVSLLHRATINNNTRISVHGAVIITVYYKSSLGSFDECRPSVMQAVANRQLKLECGPMPSLMAALPNIGGALC